MGAHPRVRLPITPSLRVSRVCRNVVDSRLEVGVYLRRPAGYDLQTLVTQLPRVGVPDSLADSREELTYVIPQDLRFVSRLRNHMDVI